jgi:hypothetical protein
MASDSPLLQTDSSQHSFQSEVSTTAPLAAAGTAIRIGTRFLDLRRTQTTLQNTRTSYAKGMVDKIQRSIKERNLAHEKLRSGIPEVRING